MPSSVIKAYIEQDVVDYLPSQIISLNPGSFTTEDQVPKYEYKSLMSIMMGASSIDSVYIQDFKDHIVADTGKSLPQEDWAIIFNTAYGESVFYPGISDNTPGAEYAKVTILFRRLKPDSSEDAVWDSLRLAEIRVRQLIDQSLRQNIGLTSDVPIPSAEGEYTGYFKCIWKGCTSNITTYEVVAQYEVQYQRTFVKTFLP